MASNHTKELAACEAAAAEYLWAFKKGVRISKKNVAKMAKLGLISMSNLLESVILDNSKLQHSNKKGEDFTDGSDAKYATARNRIHDNGSDHISMRHWADVIGLKNKRGTLRIFISHYDSRTKCFLPFMFKIPYGVWSKNMTQSGGLKFYFSTKNNELTEMTTKRFGKYLVNSIEELAS